MRRLIIALYLSVLIVAGLTAQVDRLETFQANFSSANIQTRLEILRAADAEDAAEFGPLYGQALSFVVSNAEDLTNEPLLREIALKVIDRIDAGGYTPAVNDLWRLFEVYDETSARIEILNVLGSLAGERPEETGYLAEWVATQNNVRQAGGEVDLQVLTAALEALGELAAPVAFEPLLDVILIQYPDFVTETARIALDQLGGSELEQAAEAIRGKYVTDKPAAFLFFIREDYLADADKTELARITLNDALRMQPNSLRDQEALRQLRFAAATVIREAEYGDATNAVIRHFNETVLEFDRDRVTKDRVLQAIATLGAMGTEAASLRLTDYLELLNTYTERDRPYDTQILLATIRNLETLDYPSSYNALFLTQILE
nr:hypothetical protein [Spirochaeta sp.]